jgi:hypothetical protein
MASLRDPADLPPRLRTPQHTFGFLAKNMAGGGAQRSNRKIHWDIAKAGGFCRLQE